MFPNKVIYYAIKFDNNWLIINKGFSRDTYTITSNWNNRKLFDTKSEALGVINYLRDNIYWYCAYISEKITSDLIKNIKLIKIIRYRTIKK